MAKKIHLQLLIDGCRKGKRASQLKLYEHFYSYGMGISLRYSKDRQEALEILNDSFLKAFSKIHQYNSEQPFKPWFRRIIVNAAIDYYRKYHKTSDSLEIAFRATPSQVTHNLALENLVFEDLLLITQKLPPAYLMVFNLYVMEHYSHQEIADKLGISIGTSKSNLAKARAKIKTMLATSYDIHLKSERNGG